MDVLNTYGGGTAGATAFLSVIFFALAVYGVYLILASVLEGEPVLAVLGIVVVVACAAMGMSLLNVKSPIRHEVTLRPGHVIDAAKYDVIEQRGAIYVIEEREQTEAK